jgi:hypothetical protein
MGSIARLLVADERRSPAYDANMPGRKPIARCQATWIEAHQHASSR